jgi:RsiW-degrading membrane proteinase PrsW (M82 family)
MKKLKALLMVLILVMMMISAGPVFAEESKKDNKTARIIVWSIFTTVGVWGISQSTGYGLVTGTWFIISGAGAISADDSKEGSK